MNLFLLWIYLYFESIPTLHPFFLWIDANLQNKSYNLWSFFRNRSNCSTEEKSTCSTISDMLCNAYYLSVLCRLIVTQFKIRKNFIQLALKYWIIYILILIDNKHEILIKMNPNVRIWRLDKVCIPTKQSTNPRVNLINDSKQ